MFAIRYTAVLVLVVAALVGVFVWKTNAPDSYFAFKLGLDLSGGTHLVYNADTSKMQGAQIAESMAALQAVI